MAINTDKDTNAGEDLGTWIRDHQVTWEVGPWMEMVDRKPASIGFELRLFARRGAYEHPTPGCEQCLALYHRLCEVARAAVPRDSRPTQYEIDPFDASFHLRPEAQWSPEVQLAVHVVHREGYLRPVDDCERKCMEEIQCNLRQLGVQARTWSEWLAHEAHSARHTGGMSTTERS